MSRFPLTLVSAVLVLSVLPSILGCAEARTANVEVGAAESTAPANSLAPTDAPWIRQPDGAPRIDDVALWPSLRFASGVTYAEALQQTFVSVEETGAFPASAKVELPLPAEVVLVRSSDSSVGLRLSMAAPWGWTPDSRLIRAPSLGLPGTLSPDEVAQRFKDASAAGKALPEGAHVDVPQLQPCQVALDTPDNRPPCQ